MANLQETLPARNWLYDLGVRRSEGDCTSIVLPQSHWIVTSAHIGSRNCDVISASSITRELPDGQ